MAYLLEPDGVAAQGLTGVVGPDTVVVPSAEALRWRLRDDPAAYVVVVGPSVDADTAFATADSLRLSRPDLSLILVRSRVEHQVMTQAFRSGVREVVSEREPAELRAALHRAAQLATAVRQQTGGAAPVADGADTTPGKVVTVFSAKGGAGKTTSALNIAAQLAGGGTHRVCVVDLDLAFGDVGVALRLKPRKTISDAVAMTDELDLAGVRSLLTEHSPGLSVLLAPVEPALAESVSADLVTGLLQSLRTMFDYVVVDTPPAFTEHVLASFDQSDIIVLVATMDVPTLKNLKLTIETLDVLQYPRDRWRLLLNRADEKVGLTRADVEKVLGTTIDAEIPMSRDVAAAVNRGVLISLDSPQHSVSQAFRRFAQASVVTPGTPLGTAARATTAVTSTAHAPHKRRWFTRRKALAS